jgi:hypothetical protein
MYNDAAGSRPSGRFRLLLVRKRRGAAGHDVVLWIDRCVSALHEESPHLTNTTTARQHPAIFPPSAEGSDRWPRSPSCRWNLPDLGVVGCTAIPQADQARRFARKFVMRVAFHFGTATSVGANERAGRSNLQCFTACRRAVGLSQPPAAAETSGKGIYLVLSLTSRRWLISFSRYSGRRRRCFAARTWGRW